MRGNCWANRLLRVSDSWEISPEEISGKFSGVWLAISALWIGFGEMFSISVVSMSVDSGGFAGICGLSAGIKRGISILLPVMKSIELRFTIAL